MYRAVKLIAGVLKQKQQTVDFGSSTGGSGAYSFSCVSNIGLSSDTTGMGGFAGMPDVAKWVLSFLMLTGRLEIFTVLILFTPAFWSK